MSKKLTGRRHVASRTRLILVLFLGVPAALWA
jgi:hypothetical protein